MRPLLVSLTCLLPLCLTSGMTHAEGTIHSRSGMSVERHSFAQLPGWQQDDHGQALATFKRSCVKWRSLAPDTLIGTDLLAGRAAIWQKVCEDASPIAATDVLASRSFFERQFVPFAIGIGGSRSGKFTGYYEPLLKGSRTKKPGYAEPVYGKPADLPPAGGVYPLTRADIEGGALTGKGLERLWVNDPIDLFFLHVQGSGQVLLDSGERVALRFDGKNNQPYTAIGKVLIERGELKKEEVTAPAIRAWLRAHPQQARALMQQNKSFVFFSVQPAGDEGPAGAQNVPLTPERSLAVDTAFIPLGMPIYLTTRLPVSRFGDGAAYNRLMVAQDKGSAILGAVRGDVFFGPGERAEDLAGHMNSEGGFYALVPRAMADGLAGSRVKTY